MPPVPHTPVPAAVRAERRVLPAHGSPQVSAPRAVSSELSFFLLAAGATVMLCSRHRAAVPLSLLQEADGGRGAPAATAQPAVPTAPRSFLWVLGLRPAVPCGGLLGVRVEACI